MCQCPLGLIPHFYIDVAFPAVDPSATRQCPLGLIPHFYFELKGLAAALAVRVNALSGLYLISTRIKGDYK